MTNAKGEPVRADATKTDAAPESTWGASQEAKAAWERKHGKAARAKDEEK